MKLRPKVYRNPVYDTTHQAPDVQSDALGPSEETADKDDGAAANKRLEAERKSAFAEWQLRRPSLKSAPDAAAVNIGITEQDINDMFLPVDQSLLKNMSYMLLGLYLLIIVDIMVEAWTDPFYQSNSSKTAPVLLACVQIVLPIGISMGFFVLTSSTVFVRLGCYGRYLQEFALLYLSAVFTVLLIVTVKVIYIYELYQNACSLTIWHYPGYNVLWCIMRVVLLLYWAIVLYSALSVFQEKYFDAEFLIDRKVVASTTALLQLGAKKPKPVVTPRGPLAYGRHEAGDGHVTVLEVAATP